MNIPEKISLEYYQDLVSTQTRMHDYLVFYKGGDINTSSSAMIKLAKTISACANSDGGNLIYGISQKRGRAEKIDPIIDFSKTEEWLFHEIQSQIDRPIKDLKIDILELDSQENSKIIHIIIPSSNDQPHMFADSRYYRLKKTRPVVLDEAEVGMLYGKLSQCELEFLGIYNNNGLPILSGGKYSAMSFYPKILIRNAGNIVEKEYKIEISFPANLYEESFQPMQALFIRHEGSHVVFGQKGNTPMFQQEISTMIEAKIAVNTENIDSFLKGYLNINLYYSNGIKKHSLKLSDTLTYNGKTLKKDDFVDSRVLKMGI